MNVILASQNVVDDANHSLKARTSLHLTGMATGNRFCLGTLVDVLEKNFKVDPDRPTYFRHSGFGVLDLAVGNLVLEAAKSSNAAVALQTFFSNSARW